MLLSAIAVAFAAHFGWIGPTAQDNSVRTAIDRASPCVVKLYGAGINMEHGYGVGVIVSEDGLVVTASSLLLGARNLRAVLADGRGVSAQRVREDEERQIALLRIDAKGLPFLTPHSSARLQPGDTLIALGNAYKIADGDDPVSVTRGVFSMRTRLDARRRKQTFEYRGDVLLYDAITSNPGMAGGPLLDVDGNWVGLVGKVVVSERTNTYLSYALPSEEIAPLLGQPASRAAAGDRASAVGDLPQQGRTAPRITNATAATGIRLFEMGLRQSAAYVDSVAPNSPGAKAGLKPDDLILAVNGAQTRSAAEFRRRITACAPGQRVTLAIKRGEKVLMVDLVLGGGT